LRFSQVFEPVRKGDFGLTDEAIYRSIQHGPPFVPVYGGSEGHVELTRQVSEKGRTLYDEPVTVFEGEGIILSLDGSAGHMTYTKGRRFALNHHAGFLRLREGARDKVDPEFFSLFCATILQNHAVGEGSKSLTTRVLNDIKFEVPSLDSQHDILRALRPVLEASRRSEGIIASVESLERVVLSGGYTRYEVRDVPISEIFECHRGNSGLTAETIYRNLLGAGDRYEVLSSSTLDRTRMGFIPDCEIGGRALTTVMDEGLLVARNGIAGTVWVVPRGRYTLTDHAYLLTKKAKFSHLVSLPWFAQQYRHVFLDFASHSANSTWDKTGFMSSVRVDIPALSEQEQVASNYSQLESIGIRLRNLRERTLGLIELPISAA
jgi:hypothetical protein